MDRQKALDTIQRKVYEGKWTHELVYNLYLRAFQDIDKAEEAQANFILKVELKND